MRFLEGNSLTGSFSRKFRVQLAKKVKTKSIYTPPLGEKKQQVCVSPKKYFWQVSEGGTEQGKTRRTLCAGPRSN